MHTLVALMVAAGTVRLARLVFSGLGAASHAAVFAHEGTRTSALARRLPAKQASPIARLAATLLCLRVAAVALDRNVAAAHDVAEPHLSSGLHDCGVVRVFAASANSREAAAQYDKAGEQQPAKTHDDAFLRHLRHSDDSSICVSGVCRDWCSVFQAVPRLEANEGVSRRRRRVH